MADFANTLAQMIASARPQHAPAPSKTPVIPGAGGMKSDVKRTSVSASANVDPLLRLFGYKTPEEKRTILSDIQMSRDKVSDDDWEKSRMMEGTQKFLAAGPKLGFPSYQLEDGSWDMAKTTEEAHARGMTPEQTLAQGGTPAENLIEGTRKMDEPLPWEKTAIETEQKIKNLQLQTEQTRLRGEKDLLPIRKLEAQTNLEAARASLAHQERLLDQAKMISLLGIPEEHLDFVSGSLTRYNNLKLKRMEKDNTMAAYGQIKTPTQERDDILDHTSSAQQLIGELRTIPNTNQAVESVVSGLIEDVQTAIDAPVSTNDKEAQAQMMFRNEYYNRLTEVLSNAGLSDYSAYKVLYLGDKLGRTPDELVGTLTGLGEPVEKAKKRVKYYTGESLEPPTEGAPTPTASTPSEGGEGIASLVGPYAKKKIGQLGSERPITALGGMTIDEGARLFEKLKEILEKEMREELIAPFGSE